MCSLHETKQHFVFVMGLGADSEHDVLGDENAAISLELV